MRMYSARRSACHLLNSTALPTTAAVARMPKNAEAGVMTTMPPAGI
ncbi:hypothetical protein [uncultured Bradyrhizobium sp.]|nr:hypothetical protein [uncultured Bradyrhizobium sp.]